MKRIFVVLIIGIVCISAIACSKAENQEPEVKQATVRPIEADEEIEESENDTESISEDNSVDLDLTTLSSTVIYSEVYNMMMTPSDYEGKTVKMEGICNMYQDTDTGKKYYACIVQDATKCCSQGLEFVLDEDDYTEDDYPQIGEDITIQGTFTTYEEDGHMYLTMLNSILMQ